ncbi:MAG: adenosylmethionine decarboxylase [Candidatus Sumerlaeota bacterium]|nr:adenosylmethionine decarboxylase [Candidatus Sumerlaeota bacterium]
MDNLQDCGGLAHGRALAPAIENPVITLVSRALHSQRRAGVSPQSRKSAKPHPNAVALGKHVTVECYECDEHILNDAQLLEQVCLRVVRATQATILSSHFRQFAPQGVSGVIVISESHFTIHTWPEHRYAAVDFFTCGDVINIPLGIEQLKREFETEDVVVSADMARGIVGNNGVEKQIPTCENNQHVFSLSWRDRFEKTGAWGLSTSIDLHDCDPEKIRDARRVRRFAHELCDRIGMQRFGEAVVVNFGADERIEGFSMTQLLDTSLLSGHFANATNRAYIDIFSCRYYEPREAAEFTLEFFSGRHYQMQVALRS